MNVWSITDIGAVRRDNQDSLQTQWLDDQTLLAVVCDGMGGAKAGSVASRMAVEQFVQSVGQAGSGADWPQVLKQAARSANTAVNEESIRDPEHEGMVTTMVAALVTQDALYILNVGDSRCYQIVEGELSQVTRDHSLVGDLLERGEITREQARVHPQRNLITRALGVEESVKSDLFRLPNRGGYLLLCSDGLSNVVRDEELRREVVAQDKENCCRRLLQLALDRGAPDNVTAIVVQL